MGGFTKVLQYPRKSPTPSSKLKCESCAILPGAAKRKPNTLIAVFVDRWRAQAEKWGKKRSENWVFEGTEVEATIHAIKDQDFVVAGAFNESVGIHNVTAHEVFSESHYGRYCKSTQFLALLGIFIMLSSMSFRTLVRLQPLKERFQQISRAQAPSDAAVPVTNHCHTSRK